MEMRPNSAARDSRQSIDISYHCLKIDGVSPPMRVIFLIGYSLVIEARKMCKIWRPECTEKMGRNGGKTTQDCVGIDAQIAHTLLERMASIGEPLAIQSRLSEPQ